MLAPIVLAVQVFSFIPVICRFGRRVFSAGAWSNVREIQPPPVDYGKSAVKHDHSTKESLALPMIRIHGDVAIILAFEYHCLCY